jgi:putative transcriptional regulator
MPADDQKGSNMAIVRYTLDPANLPKLSEETKARLDAMTDEELTSNALSDLDNPPLTDEELQFVRIARGLPPDLEQD